jgi:hypothetical protein
MHDLSLLDIKRVRLSVLFNTEGIRREILATSMVKALSCQLEAEVILRPRRFQGDAWLMAAMTSSRNTGVFS